MLVISSTCLSGGRRAAGTRLLMYTRCRDQWPGLRCKVGFFFTKKNDKKKTQILSWVKILIAVGLVGAVGLPWAARGWPVGGPWVVRGGPWVSGGWPVGAVGVFKQRIMLKVSKTIFKNK